MLCVLYRGTMCCVSYIEARCVGCLILVTLTHQLLEIFCYATIILHLCINDLCRHAATGSIRAGIKHIQLHTRYIKDVCKIK